MKTYFEMIEPLARKVLSPVFNGCLEDLQQQLTTQEGKFFIFLWRSGAKVVEVGRTTPWISPQLLDLTSTVIIANAGKIRLINKQIITNKYM